MVAARGSAFVAVTLVFLCAWSLLMDMTQGAAWGAHAEAAPGEFKTVPRASTEEGSFCVVVRTYRGHGGNPNSGLPRLLRSFQRQSVQNWEAIVVVMDGQPFESLHHILRDLNDERIWVFAEWVGPEYAARVGADWSPTYHGMLYNLTDDAIQMCDRRTEWLLVTNGDNEYADSFFATARSQGAEADILAFDFYSRFHRITAPSCERFAAAAAPPLAGPRPGPGGMCKANRLRWCHTDLGANILRHSRFYDEGRSFGLQRSGGLGLGPAHADGLLAQELVQAGWRVKRVADGCHFSHAPNPQACAWGGGVWDDREVGAAAGSSQGGDCLTPEQARWVMDNDPNAEQVEISLAQDGAVHAYEGVLPTADFRVSCLRRKDFASAHVWGATIDWYSEYCADDADVAVARDWRAQSARARAEYEEQQRLAAQEKSATKEEL